MHLIHFLLEKIILKLVLDFTTIKNMVFYYRPFSFLKPVKQAIINIV